MSTSEVQPREPKVADFEPGLVHTIIPVANKRPASNVLVLLHGLGGSHLPFADLAQKLALPEVISISIRGHTPLPFAEDGYHWGDDLIFDQSTGGLDPDGGFERTLTLLNKVVEGVLVKKLGWRRRCIFFLGFGQGGMAAIDFAARLSANKDAVMGDTEYGGVVSIGGAVPFTSPSPVKKAATPVLMLGAETNSHITEEAEKRARNVFETVQLVKWKGRKGDGMMTNADETRPIMEFFARRLRSREGVPEGAVEIV
ncbi:hypothetical protein RUND412_004620 [Rhizina undulata]